MQGYDYRKGSDVVMLYADEYLAKYASTSSDKDKAVAEERTLIERVQRSGGNDAMAMNKLIRLYRGVFHTCIQNSGILSVMDKDTAMQYALKSFKKTVKDNFNLKNNMAKPVTYITNSITGDLKKVMADNMNTAAVGSQDLQRKSKVKALADKLLEQQLGRKPTYEETLHFIKNEMNTGKDITIDNLKRIDMYKTKEYSANQIIGGENKPDGAQVLTFSDVMNKSDETPQDFLKKQREEQAILNHLESYTNDRATKRLIMNMFGFGEFKNNKARGLNSAALNSNMTYHEALKKINDYKADLRKKGLL